MTLDTVIALYTLSNNVYIYLFINHLQWRHLLSGVTKVLCSFVFCVLNATHFGDKYHGPLLKFCCDLIMTR